MRNFGVKSFLFLLCVLANSGVALAQTKAPATSAATTSDAAQRLALSKRMHELRPIRLQVEESVDRAARDVPADQREAFKTKTLAAIDYNKLQDISIKAMASTFTAPELQHMIDYFSAPEAKTIGEKMPIYLQLIHPDIVRMLDSAMMKAHTGAAGENIAPDAATSAGPAITSPTAPKAPTMAPATRSGTP